MPLVTQEEIKVLYEYAAAVCHRLKHQTEYQKDFETEALLARAVKQEGNTYTFLDMKLEPYTVKICPNESITFEDQIYKY